MKYNAFADLVTNPRRLISDPPPPDIVDVKAPPGANKLKFKLAEDVVAIMERDRVGVSDACYEIGMPPQRFYGYMSSHRGTELHKRYTQVKAVVNKSKVF